MNTKIERIHNKYDKLTNQERLRLVTNAIERGDDEELGALLRSTAKKTYTMRDAWMVDRFDAIWRISVVYWLTTEELLRTRGENQHLLRILKSDTAEFLNLDVDDPTRQKRVKAIEHLCEQLGEHDSLLWAVAQAIVKLAEIIQLKPAELLVYTPPAVKDRLAIKHPQLDQASENQLQQMVGMYYRLFAAYWPDLPASVIE